MAILQTLLIVDADFTPRNRCQEMSQKQVLEQSLPADDQSNRFCFGSLVL